MNARKLEKLVDRLVAGKALEELPIPFRAVAVDITAGEEIVLSSGPVSRAVMASPASP